ncbi:MAG: cell envelope biogenesis protein LolA [Prevotella sp.]|nr:cell envelope biogenesis protein LolA [Prevotella sp.]
MEKLISVLLLYLFAFLPLNAQSAKQVLDKTAAVVSNKNGAQASFTMKGTNIDTSGTIAVKGRKFHATTPQATIWFDGNTQWTYMKKNEEVNVSTPSESELAAINPYNFIYLYKNGYSYTMEKKNGQFIVHLKATGKKSIQEMLISVSQKSYIPSKIRMKQSKGWTTIDITNFKTASLSDGMFRFNSKDFPQAEVIDLR